VITLCHPEQREGIVPSIQLAPLNPGHRSKVTEILAATHSFRGDEIDVALELFDEAFEKGSSDYEFVGAFTTSASSPAKDHPLRFAQGDRGDRLFGYACYGATPGTLGTYDLYWIAVHPEHHGEGGGSRLLDEVERRLRERAARMLVVETSARTDYESTRRFYERRGYGEHARINDFYAFGDDRVIYAKRLSP
jgi:ribosomal protein S18 acetylase RimI-like enzyme